MSESGEDFGTALRNARRRREASAGIAIAASLGTDFTSRQMGGGDEVDCVIYRGTTAHVVVEITEDVDQDYQRDLSFSYDKPEEVIRDLPLGYGEWAIEFVAGTRIDSLDIHFMSDLIRDLIRSGRTNFSCFETLTRNSRFHRFVEAGVLFVVKMPISSSNRAQIMFGQRQQSSFISSDQNLYADYLEDFLAKDKIREKVYRFTERADRLPAWFTVIIGSGSSNSVRLRSRRVSLYQELPTRSVAIPSGVNAVWLLSEELVPQIVVDGSGECHSIADFQMRRY